MQVSGLASGLDTANIVRQLMAVERSSGQGLTKGKVTSESLLSALQRLNSLVKTMQTAAEGLVPDALTTSSAWSATTATSSKPDLATATTTATASAGSVAFSVRSVATAGAVVSGEAVAGTELLNGGAAFSFDVTEHAGSSEPKVTTISVASGARLADVAKAVNDARLGVQATMVQVSPGHYRLQIQSTTTGRDTDVTVSGGSPLGTYTLMREGTDTVLHLGPATGGFDVTSSTDTVTDLMPGVSVTAVKADPAIPVTVTVANDVEGLAAKVKAMVDAANGAIDNIKVNSNFDQSSKTAGVFLGDSVARELQTRITNVVVGTTALSASIAGVSIDRQGNLTFDKGRFSAAYAADPAKVEAALVTTAKNLAEVGKQSTSPTDGLLSVRIQGEQRLVADYTKQISRFEDRMSLRQQGLERQFAALESMLSKLQAQGSWLTGQIASLPKISNRND
ncbi:MAG TPA: flagellar filament capping protein FliD [Dermatophilaceae bacterium]|nr:flagellar filament capping protein FliD [Dermatophilaceae bacterium]